jgi:DNA-binding IclR family transcriptional regulator
MRNTLLTADRALRTLQAFDAEGRALTVSEIAAKLGVHRSTASRLARTLAARGFLERASEGEAFQLGPELGRLGMLALSGRELADLARKPMSDLAERTGETVTLTVRHGDEMTTIAQVDSSYVVGVQNWVGRRTPLHCTSDGKVLLAFGAGSLPGGRLAALTGRTITRRADLKRQLDRARSDGYASATGEFEEELYGVAAPVRDTGGRCVAALSVSGPSYRVEPASFPRLAQACEQAADRIGASLVYTSNGK